MSERGHDNRRIEGLLKQRAESAESTRRRLNEALDRFKGNKLRRIAAGSKLTVRNLAAEAEPDEDGTAVSKDTPLSRYPKGHPKQGEYRFPDVVSRFGKLTKKQERKEAKEGLIVKLRRIIRHLRRRLLDSVRANNLLDAQNVDLKRRNDELEKDNARLREEIAQLIRRDTIRKVPAIR
jgi:hypothetical protein